MGTDFRSSGLRTSADPQLELRYTSRAGGLASGPPIFPLLLRRPSDDQPRALESGGLVSEADRRGNQPHPPIWASGRVNFHVDGESTPVTDGVGAEALHLGG